MRNLFIHIICLSTWTACNKKTVDRPVWVNATSIISMPVQSLEFRSNDRNWTASILSFVQPIPLLIKYTGSGFIVSQPGDAGVIEGPAQICLTRAGRHFFYEVNLLNRSTGEIAEKDYRSPKTVNPDSSLQQQKMNHSIDQWRNLVFTQKSGRYFREGLIALTSKTGIYRAQAEMALSSYYVQPGSCVSVQVRSGYSKDENLFTVTAGPLKDKYNNTVADGTAVVFIYTDGQFTHRMEATLLGGYAAVKIPAMGDKNYSLMAKVNETCSNKINLKP